jgi:hypothetical protein
MARTPNTTTRLEAVFAKLGDRTLIFQFGYLSGNRYFAGAPADFVNTARLFLPHRPASPKPVFGWPPGYDRRV